MDAARQLFVERGYGATTVEAIGKAAGVPVATVYRLFSSMVGILKALLDASIAGDDDEVPVAARPHVRDLLEDSDVRRQLHGFVLLAADINGRTAPVYGVLVTAAGSDPEAATLLEHLTSQRQEGQRLIARAVARAGRLRADLRERDAADIIHALLSPELYRLLVGDRRWAVDRYEWWLSDTIAAQLLGPPPG